MTTPMAAPHKTASPWGGNSPPGTGFTKRWLSPRNAGPGCRSGAGEGLGHDGQRRLVDPRSTATAEDKTPGGMIDETRSRRVCTSATGSSGPAAPVHFKTARFLASAQVSCRNHVRINANFQSGWAAPSGFFDQGVFDEADHRRDDSPSDAAARQLPGQRSRPRRSPRCPGQV
jgi:hypothetical protein